MTVESHLVPFPLLFNVEFMTTRVVHSITLSCVRHLSTRQFSDNFVERRRNMLDSNLTCISASQAPFVVGFGVAFFLLNLCLCMVRRQEQTRSQEVSLLPR